MTDEKPPTFEANVVNEPAMEEEEQKTQKKKRRVQGRERKK